MIKVLLPLLLLFHLKAAAELVVHEWGSINLVTGQEKVVVGNIADDQSDLPPFVELWSNQTQVRPMMIEKPILYFYTGEKQSVIVTAHYPDGIFTQWWPKPNAFAPRILDNDNAPAKKGGSINWRVTLDPTGAADNQLPPMEDHIWWPIARDVDAATVISDAGGTEKFLFYRGAGTFTPTLKVGFSDKGEFLFSDTEDAASRDIYSVSVREGGDPQIAYRPSLSAERLLLENADAAAKHLQARLEAKGLFPKEAAGMVRIWKTAMFEAPGQRAMYLMEREDIDRMLPLRIIPEPDKTVRVFLVRFECLGPEAEANLEAWISQLGAQSFEDRKAAKEKLMQTGRLGEAVMRSAYEKTKDPEVKRSLKQILEAITPRNPNP